MSDGNNGAGSNGKLKVVRIISRLNVGGPARQACFLHEQLAHCSESVLVAGKLDPGEADMSYLLPPGNHVVQVDALRRSIRPWTDIRAFWNILTVLRRERPHIVHTHCSKAGTLGRIAAALLRVPVRIHTYHGNVFHGHFGPFTSRLFIEIEHLLGALTTRVVAISKSQAEELSGKYKIVGSEKVTLIPNGYDLGPFFSADGNRAIRWQCGIDDAKFLVTWAGRLAPIKNINLLAEIVRAGGANPELHFMIVGDGTERMRLEHLTRGCPNVTFLGWRAEMPAVWASADVALLTSRNEGTPTTLIEAMATGKPFVSTNVGGISDLAIPPLRNGFSPGVFQAGNGFLTPSSAPGIIACLEMLARDRALAARMGREGQRFVRGRFRAERLLRDIENLYLEVAAEAGIHCERPAPAGDDSSSRRRSV
jgi:glycosyltransferase involved in cell wall biosynthesis